MSSNIDQSEAEEVCANCGKVEVDEVKLKKCDGCNLVKYCSVECQKDHRPQHKEACKERAAEIRDDKLFTQPDESHVGECPICCLPLPIDESKSGINSCCCKRICLGCSYANKLRAKKQAHHSKCPFCRESLPTGESDEDLYQIQTRRLMKRVEANDPVALRQMGLISVSKEIGQYDAASAAALGNAEAHFNLSCMYHEGVVEENVKKQVYHLEEAAIGGHPMARFNLGCIEWHSSERYDRASKHWVVAAKLGYDNALEKVKKCFMDGFVSKEAYEAALRGHQAAVDATKSKQRDEAEKAIQEGRLLYPNN